LEVDVLCVDNDDNFTLTNEGAATATQVFFASVDGGLFQVVVTQEDLNGTHIGAGLQ